VLDFLCTEAPCSPPLRLAQLLSTAFFAVLFLQSGLDKILDRHGNVEWLTAHFARSPLAGQVALMLTIVTITELAAGAISLVGAVLLAMRGSETLALAGTALSAVSLLMLFFGQRVAKDYPGAAVIASYFVVALVALFLFHAPA
jgi:hypothetical protein